MKFSVAAIFLSQSLPTLSEVPVRDKRSLSGLLSRTSKTASDLVRGAPGKRLNSVQRGLAIHSKGLGNGPGILKSSNVYCDPSSTDPDTGILSCGDNRVCQASEGNEIGGICVPKIFAGERRSVVMPKRARLGRLINQGVGATPVPCDPTTVDVGILACGQDEVCQVDRASELGGFCSRASVASRRLDTVGICNETSPYFLSSCDCTGFDDTTGTGVVDCLLYDNYPAPGTSLACEGLTLTISVAYTYEESVPTAYTSCYALKTPYSQKVCYTYLVSDESCSLTFNDQPCASCENSNSTYYDCRNVEGGGTGVRPLQLIPALDACLYPLAGNGSNSYNCTQLCSEGDYIPYAYIDFNVTIPGIGEMNCGYLAISAYVAQISDDLCPIVSTAAQSGCCAYQCDLCGPTAYIPVDNWDKKLNLTEPGYEGLTCGSFANAAYVNFTIPDGKCDSIARLIQPTCCEKIVEECFLCDGPLTNPDANVTIEGYTASCSTLESIVSGMDCADVAKEVSPVCCSGSSATPVATPTAAPGESGGDAPSDSGEQESSDAARCILTRGGLMPSLIGVMIAAVALAGLSS